MGAAERGRERALGFALAVDGVLLSAFVVVSVLAGSLALMAEALRGGLLWSLGLYALWVMRRVHRRALHRYDFGSGKVEQFANLLVAIGLLLGAAWLGVRVSLAVLSPPAPAPPGLRLAVMALAVVNLGFNLAAFAALWRSGRDGTSLVMRGQIASRLGKCVTSAVVAAALAAAALAPASWLGRNGDTLAAVLVVAVMLTLAARMLRESLPDLLDRSLAENRQIAINRVLAGFFDRYDGLGAVRSRQSATRCRWR